MLSPNKILLVDDDVFNRQGVSLFLSREGFEIVEAGDEQSAWQAAIVSEPGTAVVDISIPPDANTPPNPVHSCGIPLAHSLKQAYPSMGVILFSAYSDRGSEILSLLQAGQRGIGYKLKGSRPQALLEAIHDVLAGRVVIDPEVQFNRRSLAQDLLTRVTADERQWVEGVLHNLGLLTGREQEVAQRLAASHNTDGIAQALGVASKTAENYIGHVYDKLGLNEMKRVAPHLRQVVILAKACMIYELQGKS